MLEAWLLVPTQGNQVRLFAVLYSTALALRLALSVADQQRFIRTRPPTWRPMPLLRKIHLPRLGGKSFALVGLGLLLSLVGVAWSPVPRLCLVLALAAYFLYFSQITQLAYIDRKTNLIPLVLLVLLCAPGLDKPWSYESPVWPLLLVKVLIAQVYLGAGLQKLSRTGWGWIDGKSLQAYLLQHYLWGHMDRARQLANAPLLCAGLSTATLFFELTFWLVLVIPILSPWYAAAGLVFHLGTGFFMRIHYFKYFAPNYLVFATGWMFAQLQEWGWLS